MVAYCDRCNVKKIAVASMVMKVHFSLLIAFSPLYIPDTYIHLTEICSLCGKGERISINGVGV